MTPASIRNNNPGAMYPGPSARKFGSTSFEVLHSKDGEHKIATFPDGVSGAAAMFDLLASPAYTGRTLEAAIRKWCGGFRPESYLHVLQSRAGVTGDTPLTAELVRDPAFAIPLCKAMAVQEAGREFPMSDADWGAAHARAFTEVSQVSEKPTNFDKVAIAAPAVKPLVKSRTLWNMGLGGSFLTWLGGLFASGMQWLTEAGAQFAQLAPARDMLATIGGNSSAIAWGLGVGCLISAACVNIGDKTPAPPQEDAA